MKITDFSVRNYQFTLIVFIALVAIGLNSLFNMPRGEDPDFQAPQFAIVVVYPGTSPTDMERLVVDPIEKKFNELDDIKKVISRIDDGLAVVRVEFKYETDPDTKYQDVVREINAIRGELPADILSTDIMKFSPSDVNIVQVALVSQTAPYSELEAQSKKLKEELAKVKSLKNVDNWAFPKQQVQVAVNLDKLAAAKVPLTNVLMSIQSENANIPGGSIEMGSRKLNIKTSGDYQSLEEIKNTVVKSNLQNIVRIRDVADVKMGYEEETYQARFNGQRSVFVTASRKMGTNVFKVDDKIKPILAQFESQLPKNIRYEKVFDNAESVRNRLEHFGKDFMIAIFLVLLTLIPLGFRASLVVMLSIPLSLLMGLFMLDKLGFTINQLSIVGFVVALGLLVDDSIVVVENIERYLRNGYSPREAATEATKQISLAVLGCTATLIFAFLPLMFLPEGSGDFIRGLPTAVVTTILASLFVSLTIVPFMASVILKADHNPEGNFFLRILKRLISGSYRQLLHRAMANPKITLFVTLLIFLGVISLIPKVGFSIFPNSEKPMFLVNIETPLGTNLKETNRVAALVEKEVAKIEPLRNYATSIGKGNPRIYYNVIQRNETPNFAQIFVQLNKEVSPPEKAKVIDALRSRINSIPNAKVEVKDFEQGPPTEAPIAIRLFGENLDTLRNISLQIETLLNKTEGTIYVNNELKTESQEFQVVIDHEKAGLFGVQMVDIDRSVRMAVAGLNIGKYRVDNGDDYSINVSIEKGGKTATNVIFDKIYVNSVTGAPIPLRQLAEVKFQTSPNGINHYDKDRYTVVTSFLKTGYNTTVVTDKLLKELDKTIKFPKGYKYVAAGEIEAKQEAFGGLGTIILVTVFGLLGILILEFKTFKSTLVVLSVVPLGIIGAVLMLFAVGYTFSFVAIVGLIALVGIEVKNSILMVDYTEQLRASGMPLREAIEEAGETRFVPIILTTLTAIGGLIPLAIEFNPLYSPLAWVLIGGLISSTLLTRIVTPVLYLLLAPRLVK